jgi:hypothetical protein
MFLLILWATLFCVVSCGKRGGSGVETTATTAESESADSEESLISTENTDPSTDTEPAQTVQEGTESGAVEEPATTGSDDVICLNPDIVYTYTDEDFSTLNGKIDTLTSLLADNDPDKQEAFLTLYADIEDDDFAALTEQYLIASILNMVYSTDADRSACFLSVSQMYNDALQRLIVLYDDIDASVYADAFFEDWSEDERQQAVAMAGNYTDELKQLRVAYDELTDEYYKLPQDDSYLTSSAELYMRAVQLNKQIATLCGYDDYMTYAYSMVYDRDYTPADVQQMKEYVQQYIVPQLYQLWNKISAMMENISITDYMAFYSYMTADLSSLGVVDSLGDGDEAMIRTLESYLLSLGGDVRSVYHSMWTDNHFIVANNENLSRSGAFSVYFSKLGYPLFYFGPGYQTTYTIIHEFGHCYAMDQSETMDIPMDLAEVHSQGNEWLYTSFLKGTMSAQSYKLLAYYKMFSDLSTICNCLAVNEFEIYVYTHDDYQAEDLDNVMVSILKDLGIYDLFTEMYADPVSYWHYVVVDNPGYYISYAVSLLPSIDLYCMSLENYETATAAYLDLCTVGSKDTFLSALERAGISSPFEEKTYTDLIAGINAISTIK